MFYTALANICEQMHTFKINMLPGVMIHYQTQQMPVRIPYRNMQSPADLPSAFPMLDLSYDSATPRMYF